MNINRNLEECTGCSDVFKLLECTSEAHSQYRNFALYKTSIYNNKEATWCYYLLIADDPFPIVITEEDANKILKAPEYGCSITINHWFSRWR